MGGCHTIRGANLTCSAYGSRGASVMLSYLSTYLVQESFFRVKRFFAVLFYILIGCSHVIIVQEGKRELLLALQFSCRALVKCLASGDCKCFALSGEEYCGAIFAVYVDRLVVHSTHAHVVPVVSMWRCICIEGVQEWFS